MVGSYYQNSATEIVSLTGSIPDCLNDLSSHPNYVQSAAGGALPDAGTSIVFYNCFNSLPMTLQGDTGGRAPWLGWLRYGKFPRTYCPIHVIQTQARDHMPRHVEKLSDTLVLNVDWPIDQ